jgi:hypothetical protein
MTKVLIGWPGLGLSDFDFAWQAGEQEAVRTAKSPKAWPKSLLIFKRALDKTLDESGKLLKPFSDGPEILAVASATVREEFLKTYPHENAKTKGKAFERAIKQAVEANLACAREIDAEGFKTFLWRLDKRT